MKAHLPPGASRQEQDLTLRLQQAAQRRASDAVLRQATGRTSAIAPDAAPLLNAIFARTAGSLPPGAPGTPPDEQAREAPAGNDCEVSRSGASGVVRE
ncbi:MAG TPA: hypothetical protein VF458_07310 [Ktedonobacteraceae bacterium]